MYRTLNPVAYAAGLAYGYHPVGKYAAGYTGVEIRRADEETPSSIAYAAYCEGYCEAMRKAHGDKLRKIIQGGNIHAYS